MDRYAKEIEQLRWMGFAEGLPIARAPGSAGVVARLESGRAGVAVEFFEPEPAPSYAIVALDASAIDASGRRIHRWDDVVRDLHRCMPPNDD
jgi:hypothetical protein